MISNINIVEKWKQEDSDFIRKKVIEYDKKRYHKNFRLQMKILEGKVLGFIYLDTFSFQALKFYKQNGYEVFGTIEDHPKGFNQYFLHKKFDK